MTRFRPLILALIPAMVMCLLLSVMFAYCAWQLDLPLVSAVPVKFTLGATVFTYLAGIGAFVGDQ